MYGQPPGGSGNPYTAQVLQANEMLKKMSQLQYLKTKHKMERSQQVPDQTMPQGSAQPKKSFMTRIERPQNGMTLSSQNSGRLGANTYKQTLSGQQTQVVADLEKASAKTLVSTQ